MLLHVNLKFIYCFLFRVIKKVPSRDGIYVKKTEKVYNTARKAYLVTGCGLKPEEFIPDQPLPAVFYTDPLVSGYIEDLGATHNWAPHYLKQFQAGFHSDLKLLGIRNELQSPEEWPLTVAEKQARISFNYTAFNF